MEEAGYSQVIELSRQLRGSERRIQGSGRGTESADGEEGCDQGRTAGGGKGHSVALGYAEGG